MANRALQATIAWFFDGMESGVQAPWCKKMTLVCLFVRVLLLLFLLLLFCCGSNDRRNCISRRNAISETFVLWRSKKLKRLAPKSLRRHRLNIFAIWNIEQFIDFQSHDAVICLIDTIDRLRECSFHNVCDTPHKGDFVFWS